MTARIDGKPRCPQPDPYAETAAKLLGLGLDGHAGGDGAGGVDVGSQAAVADESFEGDGFDEALQVCAGLTEMLAEILDVANEEPASDKVVQIDTPGDDVAAGVGVAQAVSVGEPKNSWSSRLRRSGIRS